jgi:signal transduction protein with GAF and PtsI domain
MFDIATLLYSEAFNRARNIYLQRASSLLNEETEQRMGILTDDLKDLLFQLDPTAQGAHALVWPYFVVAAESREIDFRHYFRDKLQYIWETTGYRNVHVAIMALPEIWRKQTTERWTSVLTRIKTVIM